jgi:hypothetical protein
LILLLLLLFLGEVMTHSVSRHGSDDSVVARQMPGYSARCRALEATTSRGVMRSHQQCQAHYRGDDDRDHYSLCHIQLLDSPSLIRVFSIPRTRRTRLAVKSCSKS